MLAGFHNGVILNVINGRYLKLSELVVCKTLTEKIDFRLCFQYISRPIVILPPCVRAW